MKNKNNTAVNRIWKALYGLHKFSTERNQQQNKNQRKNVKSDT